MLGQLQVEVVEFGDFAFVMNFNLSLLVVLQLKGLLQITYSDLVCFVSSLDLLLLELHDVLFCFFEVA